MITPTFDALFIASDGFLVCVLIAVLFLVLRRWIGAKVSNIGFTVVSLAIIAIGLIDISEHVPVLAYDVALVVGIIFLALGVGLIFRQQRL